MYNLYQQMSISVIFEDTLSYIHVHTEDSDDKTLEGRINENLKLW